MARLPMPFPNPRTYPNHSGVDFPQPRRTPIRASGTGRVLRLPKTLAGGYWTTIQYDNGIVWGYAHQDTPVTVVKVGQRVSEGDVIGYVGSLGINSTGPHLHLTDVNNQTYAATMAQMDTSRVVGQAAPAGDVSTPTGQGDNDMGTIDNTEANYQVFAAFLQRAFKYDVRENGMGPDWRLGSTLWEKIAAADDSADIAKIASGGTVDVDALAEKLRDGLAPEIVKALGAKLTA